MYSRDKDQIWFYNQNDLGNLGEPEKKEKAKQKGETDRRLEAEVLTLRKDKNQPYNQNL